MFLVTPLDPPKFTPSLYPPRGRSIGDPWFLASGSGDCGDQRGLNKDSLICVNWNLFFNLWKLNCFNLVVTEKTRTGLEPESEPEPYWKKETGVEPKYG